MPQLLSAEGTGCRIGRPGLGAHSGETQGGPEEGGESTYHTRDLVQGFKAHLLSRTTHPSPVPPGQSRAPAPFPDPSWEAARLTLPGACQGLPAYLVVRVLPAHGRLQGVQECVHQPLTLTESPPGLCTI